MQPEKRGGDKRQKFKKHCIACEKKYKAEYHQKNKARRMPLIRAADKAAKLAKRIWAYNYLLNNPCKECGESNPVVLEFNHRNPAEKCFAIADGLARYAFDKVKAEIEKCEVLCANCHRKVTARQFGWYSFLSQPAGSTPA